MFRYDKRTGKIEDEETGIVLRHGGKTDVDMAAYVYFDPSNPVKTATYLRPGEVQLWANFVYAGPPAKAEEGQLHWQRIVGYHIDIYELQSFYAFQTKADLGSEEVRQRVEFACRMIRNAIALEWREDPKNPEPIIDFDGSRAAILTVAKNNECWVLKA
ncbi:MAG TPA: hypothetical protein VJQ06_07740 [Rhizomicrobium sp.]|nr:hypothetical protein [Rhizomicrobium sp.]